MTPLPKRKHTHARTGKRRSKNALTLKEVLARYSRDKGIRKRLATK